MRVRRNSRTRVTRSAQMASSRILTGVEPLPDVLLGDRYHATGAGYAACKERETGASREPGWFLLCNQP